MSQRSKQTKTAKKAESIPMPGGVSGPPTHEDYDDEPEPMELEIGRWYAGRLGRRFKTVRERNGVQVTAWTGVLVNASYGEASDPITKPVNSGLCFYLNDYAALQGFTQHAPIGSKILLQYLGEKPLSGGRTYHQFRMWAFRPDGKAWEPVVDAAPEPAAVQQRIPGTDIQADDLPF